MTLVSLIGSRKIVDFIEPQNSTPGNYSVDVNFPKGKDKLDLIKLNRTFSHEGLRNTGFFYNGQLCYNDERIFGGVETERAGNNGEAFIRLGFHESPDRVQLEVLPKVIHSLKSETPLEYAERILGKVIEFVDNPDNYLD